MADLEGTVRYCNPPTATLLGPSREGLIGQKFWTYLQEKEATGLQGKAAAGVRGCTEEFYLNLVDQRQVPQ